MAEGWFVAAAAPGQQQLCRGLVAFIMSALRPFPFLMQVSQSLVPLVDEFAARLLELLACSYSDSAALSSPFL